jgi:signal transduction histidine kinase
VAEAIGGLHDIKTATSLVFRNAEAYMVQLPGETDDEKIENSPDPLKSLFKSISLLNTRLTMSSIVSNPESASFGRKRLAPIYRMFDKMCRLFEEIGAKKGIKIIMSGSSFNKVRCYDSFETLALVLIDNAVKYSLPGEPVTVKAMDSGSGVEVSIESRGPVVPEGDREKIFERGIRTTSAKEMAQGGSGLGLFIAKIVAEAHNTKIAYQAKNTSAKNNIGTNVFSFYIE